MKKLTLLCAIAAMAAPTAAAACDLDGMPGFHRYNPFGSTFGGLAPLQPELKPQAETPKAEAAEAVKSSSKAKVDTKSAGKAKKAKVAEPLPKREWESDAGNGPISAEDRETFT